MVPPASVLTNKNCGSAARVLGLLLACCTMWSGCAPPAERTLMQGKKLVDEGHFAEAVPKLEKATRLLPKFAPAWNYLGLAYQGNGQAEQALRAYRAALDLDHKLAAARYNMGCLFLEQGNLAAAIDELRSYTLLQPSAPHGLLKLGAAQFRARRLEDAEKTFRAALELQPRHPEALNALGMIQCQRRRWLDALNYFNAALAQQPVYAPALLNSAVINQQLGARSQALSRYREYLALQPRPSNADAVEALVRQLEPPAIGSPAPPRPVSTNTAVQLLTRTNTPPNLIPVVRTNTMAASIGRTNVLTASSPTKPSPVSTALTNEVAARKLSPAEKASVATNSTPPRASDVDVTRVQDEFVIPPAQELSVPSGTTSSPAAGASGANSTLPLANSTQGTNPPRKSLLARLNPFSSKTAGARELDIQSTQNLPNVVPPAPESAPRVGPQAALARYTYLSPAKPSPGNRAEADKAFRRGVKAQQSRDRIQAIAEYQTAVQADPAFFNAYYNLGLAALDVGDARLSLAAYETALTLNPESGDARYNFALGLKTGGYYLDSSEELTRLLTANPDDARAHLALANLYAQYLGQLKLAREHYLKVLELNPRHPEAGKIRFWLAANP
jgi:tetratricopeptide (TPR) repeat protein